MSVFVDYPAVAMTGTVAIRRDLRATGNQPTKIFSITVKISTVMADPRSARVEVGKGFSNDGKIVAIGFASGFNDFQERFDPPVDVPRGFIVRMFGFGDLGTEIGFQIESDQGLKDLGVSQF